MNKTPSIYTKLYWLIQDGKIRPEDLVDFSELYWPTFIRKDSYVFLKEKFNDDEYENLTKESVNPEYWINLLTIDEFFSDTLDEKRNAESLAHKLIEIWKIKLRNEFPSTNFTFEHIYDEDQGDCGLTFYQINSKGGG